VTVTARDDGWLRTHDDVRGAVCGEARRLGARAYVVPLRTDSHAMAERKVGKLGSYAVTLERFGMRPLSEASAYSLPVPEDRILQHVRTMVQGAARAAEEKRR